jgi:hypothetical protein
LEDFMGSRTVTVYSYGFEGQEPGGFTQRFAAEEFAFAAAETATENISKDYGFLPRFRVYERIEEYIEGEWKAVN